MGEGGVRYSLSLQDSEKHLQLRGWSPILG